MRSESSARATTSPAGVRAGRRGWIRPRSTASRIRSATAVHHSEYVRNARAIQSGKDSRTAVSAAAAVHGVSPACSAAATSPHSAPVATPVAPQTTARANSAAPVRPQRGWATINRGTARHSGGVWSSTARVGGVARRSARRSVGTATSDSRPVLSDSRPEVWDSRPVVWDSRSAGGGLAGWGWRARGAGSPADRRAAKWPGSPAACAWDPDWTRSPSSRTATESACRIVERRWAITIPVRPASNDRVARVTRSSVRGSIRAVASSSTTSPTSRTSSRANATSCCSPADRVVPPVPSRVSSPAGRAATQSVSPSAVKAASTSARGTGRCSATFSASVADSSSVRWVTTPTACRRPVSCRFVTSRPPSQTCPGGGSTARESTLATVDLPEPVRPTSAHVVPAGTCRENPPSRKPPS